MASDTVATSIVISAEMSTTSTSSTPTAACTSAVPGEYGHVPVGSCNSYYGFDPNFGGNLAFAVLFGLSMLAHITQAFAYRKRFCWVLIVGASWECVAFILRTLGTRDQQSLAYVIAGTLLFLLAPLWITAFAYMSVARLIHYVLPDKQVFRIKATHLTKIFVWIDIACFLVQAAGGTMLSNNDDVPDPKIIRTGQQVYMAGVGLQFGVIVVFCILMGRLYVKMRLIEKYDFSMKRVKLLAWVLFVVFVLIIVRITFRLVEFGPGVSEDNPILSNENFAFGLDAFPMLLALVLLNVMHPGMVLRGPDSEFPRLSRKEKKRVKQEKKATKKAEEEEKKSRKKRKDYHASNRDLTYHEESSDRSEMHGPRDSQRPG